MEATYEESKPEFLETLFVALLTVWKLPMRNPSMKWALASGEVHQSLEATYEESKLLVGFVQDQEVEEFGSYL